MQSIGFNMNHAFNKQFYHPILVSIARSLSVCLHISVFQYNSYKLKPEYDQVYMFQDNQKMHTTKKTIQGDKKKEECQTNRMCPRKGKKKMK